MTESILDDLYISQIEGLLDDALFLLSDLKPSDWTERHRVMGSDDTSSPGPFQYKYTPYLREVVDCLSANHPARIIAVMKGAQIGFSTGVIESGIGWIISQSPGNILFLSGHQELSEEAMNGKIDKMIESCGLRPMIKPATVKARNQRTGDTSKSKEFPGGSLIAGSASNHKLLRQRSVRYGFVDDFDAAKKKSTEAGDTRTLVQQRFAAYYDKMKLFYISTPEVKETSNIEPVFKLGDQRRYFIPCPCCGEYIPLFWSIEIEGKEGEMGGITWKVDENNKLIPESVGYVCQKCGDWFDDSRKSELNQRGEWRPTAEPSEVGYYSYHISCLYAPPGMYDWEYYVRMYMEANPPGQPRVEALHQGFLNLGMGETYEQEGSAPEAKSLQHNTRRYDIGIIPEAVSVKDNNGPVIIITCACDLNGTIDDARLDYEIAAWSEKDGCSYSVEHGSIGTFIPREGSMKFKEDREKWTYNAHHPRNVWDELKKIISKRYTTDDGRQMEIAMTGIDCGHFTEHVYDFIDTCGYRVVGVRGDKESKHRKFDADTPSFKPARERKDLYMVDVNFVKDKLANYMKLRWEPGQDSEQPAGFMNYPEASRGLYQLKNYFSHFEAEHKVTQESKTGEKSFLWKKKNTNLQNHFFDVRVYNMALKDIVTQVVTEELKIKKGKWADLCEIILGK